MKKIKFGSFPVINIHPKERQCIDTFCMKNFASLISMGTEMGNISEDTQKYITPDIIMKYFKNNEDEKDYSNIEQGIDSHISNKAETMKRAFKKLKGFYETLESIPFYKNFKTFPLYLEHTNKNNNHDYDFLLLSNDLINSQHLDEITYNDQLSLIFMVLKDQLYNKVSFNSFGTDGNHMEIRRQLSAFIEFSKNNNTDPISAFINIIKAAGANKFSSNYDGSTTKSSFMNNKRINNTLSKEMSALFRQGEIVDVNFLLKSVTSDKINKFLDDSEEDNKNSHLNNNNNTDVLNTLDRQYVTGKVSEYNKLLSMVDALIAFNKENKILTDLNEIRGDNITLKGNDGKTNVELEVKKNEIIQSIRTTYFEPVVQNIIIKTNIIYEQVIKSLTGDIKSDDEESFDFKHRFKAVQDKINNVNEAIANTSDTDKINGLRRILEGHERERRDLQNLIMLNQNVMNDNNTIKREQSKLTYNLDLIQNDLTSLLSSIENSISSKEKIEELFNVIGIKNKTFGIDELEKTNSWKDMEMYIQALEDSIKDSIKDSAHLEISNNYELDHTDDKSKSFFNLFDKDNSNTELHEYNKKEEKLLNKIAPIIKQQLYTMFIKLGRQFGQMQLNAVSQYVETRINNHPTIANMLRNPNNFKTYIFNKDLLINLYDTLNYIDNQKYIAGLLKIPPSRITSDTNKIEFILKRFRLTENPIFIMNDSNVTLYTPDYMSMIGQPFMHTISFRELEGICKIDYSRDMWHDHTIMRKVSAQNKYNNLKNSMDKAKLDGGITDEYLKKYQNYQRIEKKKKNRTKEEQKIYDDWNKHDKKEYLDAMKKKSDNSHSVYKNAQKEYVDFEQQDRAQPIGIASNQRIYQGKDNIDGYDKNVLKDYTPNYKQHNNKHNKHNKHNNYNKNQKPRY